MSEKTLRLSAPSVKDLPSAYNLPTLPNVQLLPTAKLHVDFAYQHRPYSYAIEELKRSFQLAWCGPILVNVRANGDMYVLDGATRLQVHEDLGIRDIVAEVVEGLTLQEEAFVYTLKAVNKQRTPIDLFQAEVIARNKDALVIVNVLQKFDIVVEQYAPGEPRPHPRYVITCINSLKRILKADPTGGQLQEVIDLIVQTWAYAPGSLVSNHILAMHELLTRYGEQIIHKRFVEKLGDFSPSEIYTKARSRREASPKGMLLRRAILSVLIEMYNLNLREGRIGIEG